MITREEEKGSSSSTKQEIKNINIANFIVSSRPSSSSTISSSSWSRSKDLRIVRVSKAFGGKDRHSKVCTVRGLRDRRVRLSVQTAIQLYDLQERLGLNQPSKVVDWLLNQAKHEIDELPPLQIPPPGINFPQNLHYSMIMAANNASSYAHQVATDRDDDEQKEIKDGKSRNEMDNQNSESHHQHGGYASLSTSDLLQKPSNINHSLIPGLMNHNSLAYNSSSFLRWDPSHLCLSHHHHQPEDNFDHQQFQNLNNNCVVPLQPSTFNNIITPSGSQVLYPPFGVAHPHQSFDSQMLSSNSLHVESSNHQYNEHPVVPPPIRPFHFSVMANFLTSTSHGNEANKDDVSDLR